ncbi:hypothetical protein D3C84_947410 [compost metagenome]
MPIQFKGVDGQIADPAQRAITCTKIIQRNAHAQFMQPVQLFHGVIEVIAQRGFGNFHFQLGWLKLLAENNPRQLFDQVRHAELHLTQADRQHQTGIVTFVPGPTLCRPVLVNPAS